MVCYARLYGRDVTIHRRRLWKDLSSLNNRTIVLLPKWETIVHRYHDRGDEIQDLNSLRVVYDLFKEETDKIRMLPNVIVVDDSQAPALECIDEIYNIENQSVETLGRMIGDFVRGAEKNEVSPLHFSILFDKIDDYADPEIMEHPPEKNYYAKIKKGVLSNLSREISGKNEYKKAQDPKTTRRFIYTQDSCISLIHTMLRDDRLSVHVVCRSSDVVNTFPYDLRFLVHLGHEINKSLDLHVPVEINCAMNSAHIVA